MGEQDHHGKGCGTKISFHGASWNPEPILTAFRYEAVKAVRLGVIAAKHG
jgi:hypothetical protein